MKNRENVIMLLLKESVFENYISTFHLGDGYCMFEDEFCHDIERGRGSISKCQQRMRYRLNQMVEMGLLERPSIVGTGEGSYSEFGVRAYGIYPATDLARKIVNDSKTDEEILGKIKSLISRRL